jgi:CheY-like chemotaxis protein
MIMTHRESAKAKPIVLVIDDDLAVRNSLKFALEIEGFSVRLYPTAAELLDEKDMPESDAAISSLPRQAISSLRTLAVSKLHALHGIRKGEQGGMAAIVPGPDGRTGTRHQAHWVQRTCRRNRHRRCH